MTHDCIEDIRALAKRYHDGYAHQGQPSVTALLALAWLAEVRAKHDAIEAAAEPDEQRVFRLARRLAEEQCGDQHDASDTITNEFLGAPPIYATVRTPHASGQWPPEKHAIALQYMMNNAKPLWVHWVETAREQLGRRSKGAESAQKPSSALFFNADGSARPPRTFVELGEWLKPQIGRECVGNECRAWVEFVHPNSIVNPLLTNTDNDPAVTRFAFAVLLVDAMSEEEAVADFIKGVPLSFPGEDRFLVRSKLESAIETAFDTDQRHFRIRFRAARVPEWCLREQGNVE